ncbi:hypothetical protein DRQ36_06290 [bacterium]|nr:MAG: hypothetical protein DRQ36_06290 [bacterium]
MAMSANATDSKKHGIVKRFLDAKWAWDFVQGPIYNHLVIKAASGLFEQFVHEVEAPENARILDIGSGPGHVTLMFARKYPGAEIVGVDYSPTQVRYANRLLKREALPNCSLRIGDAMSLPFVDASFDIVVSVACIKHWPDKLRGLLEIKRILAPGGKAYIAEADREASEKDFTAFAEKFTAWYVFKPFMRWYLRKIVFGKSVSADEIKALVYEAGFADVSVVKAPEGPFLIMKAGK